MTVYAYTRVSTDEQAASGLGLLAQRDLLEREATARGWQLQHVVDEGVSGAKPPSERPALGPVLERISRHDVLVVAKLDRLSRSVIDFASLMDRAYRQGWALVVLGLVDTTTPTGEFMANVLASVAQLERRMIAERTSGALQAARAQGKRLGVGNRVLDPQLLQRIVNMHQAGEGLTAIANTLNAEGVPTSRGGSKWWPSTVKGALESDRLDREAAALRARHAS